MFTFCPLLFLFDKCMKKVVFFQGKQLHIFTQNRNDLVFKDIEMADFLPIFSIYRIAQAIRHWSKYLSYANLA